jgi:hypothetical protein
VKTHSERTRVKPSRKICLHMESTTSVKKLKLSWFLITLILIEKKTKIKNELEKRDDDDEAQINQLLTVHREQS